MSYVRSIDNVSYEPACCSLRTEVARAVEKAAYSCGASKAAFIEAAVLQMLPAFVDEPFEAYSSGVRLVLRDLRRRDG